MGVYRGRVQRVLRWPVKSLRGEELGEAFLDGRGLAGDRAYSLVDEREHHGGKVLTVRQRAEMLHWRGALLTTAGAATGPDGPGDLGGPGGTAGGPLLTAPDGTVWHWDDPGLTAALRESLGVPLSLRAADGQQDRGPTVLVTCEASRAALEEELGMPLDVLRFRPNLHLDLDAPAFAEEDWGPGTLITAGDAELTVTGPHTGPCIRCAVPSWDPHGRERRPELQKWLIAEHANKFGVIMRVTRPGTVRRDDPVTASPAPPEAREGED
ncbi:MOSC N-terminal beta barrel domain-containing protein [Streptosporangium sp. NPDC048047]|uniref:MOSC domain-containing protein n=1 Tax=Streptosporangium sp. NPDC048047 TaxID=3155748 RepID=UPI003425116D